MSKHFVTGAAGFLGSHIVEKLHQIGERDIIALDILAYDVQLEGVTYVQGSVLDKKLLLKLTGSVDYIHHNAALVPLTKSGRDFYNVNVIGTRNIVACCEKHNVKKLIHMSSSAIYGIPDAIPINETTGYAPIEVYGQSKLDGEKEVWQYMDKGGSASCIRPRTIIGGKSRLGIFQILFEWIAEGKNIYVIGDGNNLFQFVHVDDLIDASIKAAFSDHNGLYNIGAAEYRTLREDLEALCRYAGTGSKVKSLPVGLTKLGLYLMDKAKLSPLAPWHYLTYHKPFVFDISKAQRELQWNPQYSNIESFIESYEWYLKNRNKMTDSKSTHKKPVPQKILKIIKYFS
ncbi:MAG: NAD(P)-dependent oxidoreductase [Proteobacteria bacterium]|nr:NAD(P)-dependent oxidoreductase [Pseudomonadota bacterium]